jgi:hypothetical protein
MSTRRLGFEFLHRLGRSCFIRKIAYGADKERKGKQRPRQFQWMTEASTLLFAFNYLVALPLSRGALG